MRRLALLAPLVFGFSLAGCGVVEVLDGIAEYDDIFTLEETHCMGLTGEAWVLHFAKVLSDDRCPEGESCEEPGEARVRVRFLREKGDPIVHVFTIPGFVDAGSGEGYHTYEVSTFRVTLLQLDPNPTGTGDASPPVATFLLRHGL